MDLINMQQNGLENEEMAVAGVVQSPVDGSAEALDSGTNSLETDMDTMKINDKTPTQTPKAPLTYDELFPALPGSGSDGPGLSTPTSSASTTGQASSGSWGAAVRNSNDSMRIQSSVITQVFHVPQEERAKIDGNSQFGESASSSICQDITKKTGAHIEISSAKDHSLTFLVTGKNDAVAKARKLVLEKFQAQNSNVIKIPKEHHKFLLGKKGKKLQDLELSTNTKIQVPSVADVSDTVTVIGTKDCIDKALHEIRVISDEQSKQAYETIDVQKIYHPFVCGGNNSNIQSLTSEYGVRINVPPVSTNKTELSIVGEKESVLKVKEIIAKIVKDMDRKCQTVSVEVPKAQHKYVIGPRGCNVSEILDTYNVSVEVPSQDTNSSTITLRGPQDKLGGALTMVYDKASSMVQTTIHAPAWLHRYIIGRKGANINKITQEYPAVHVEFTDEGELIKLEGPRDDVDQARENLETMIAEMKSRLTQDQITVDSKFHKHIIGKGGANINKIRNETNVIINIEPKGSNVIKLEGTPEAVTQVKRELEEMVKKMENEKERDIIIESRLHRHIIGQRGENIREIREMFNQVQISFPDAVQKTDTVKIRGPKEDVDACYKHLQKTVKELQESNYQVKVPIFKQFMKFIIGKGGANINKIRAETDTKIEFITNEQGTDDMLIVGRKENCEKAKERIQQIQEEQANIVEMDIIVPAKYHNSIIGTKGRLIHSISEECGGVAIKFPRADKKSDKVTIRGPKDDVMKAKKILVDLSNERQQSSFTEEVRCKLQHHKFLIGKSGASIKELRDKTGARIIFPTDKDDDKELIIIIGKKDQVADAKSILEKKIKELDNISEGTVNVPQKHHFHFIQKRGEILRQLGEQYGGVSISFPRNGTNSDVVTLKGAVECLAGAKARILEIVNELESQVSTEVVIHQRHHRTVMGHRGQSLQNITSQFNVEIKFPERPSREEALRREEEDDANEVNAYDIVKIRGEASACEAAKQALLDLVPITIEMEIPFKFHRYIIGQRGQSVRDMMQKHDVHIQVPPAAAQTDVIKISGTSTNVERAKEALTEQVKKLEDEEIDKQARSHKVTLNVATEYHPKIIGRRGAVVSKIRDKYGVNIQFPQREDVDPTLITITGYEQKCEEAKQAIMDITGDLDSMVKVPVEINSRIHARLIGQKGKSIRKVMDEYKVSISFPREEGNPNEVLITGPEDRANDCREHLLNLAEEFMMDLQDQEDLSYYTSSRAPPPSLGDSLSSDNWRAPPKPEAAPADPSWADEQQPTAAAPKVNGKPPMENGIPKKQGFIVSGAPWAQEAPNVNSSKDFPSIGSSTMPVVASSCWGPTKR